jgi:cytochrome c peroxidase
MLDNFVIKLRTVKGYRRQFLNLFGTEVNPKGIAKAIAAFARTLVSTNSAFDQFSLGNKQVMNEAIIRVMTLFKDKALCILCHNGPNFTDNQTTNFTILASPK